MIEIVAMTQAHVSQIAQIENMCFSDPWSEKSIASELENALSFWLVALDGDVVAGYVGSQSVLGETDMMNVAVHPDYRRRGIGRQLIGALILELKNRGNRSLMLEVRASNEPAKALYAELGFEQIGVRPRYYSKPREDALILRKEWTV